jgi:hypothetical protein
VRRKEITDLEQSGALGRHGDIRCIQGDAADLDASVRTVDDLARAKMEIPSFWRDIWLD